MLKETTKLLFLKISSCGCRKNLYVGAQLKLAPMLRNEAIVATTASHRLLYAEIAAKCSAESTGTTEAANQ